MSLGGIMKLKWGSAPGVSGWSFRALKQILLYKKKKNEVWSMNKALDSVTSFLILPLKGKLKQTVVQHLVRSRCVLIPKNENSFRPLGIGECFYRLMGRVVINIVGKPTGASTSQVSDCR
jgi:hypothetical protein